MAKQFRADNIGSLLRPPELLQARAAYREGKLRREQLGEIEDRSILKVLELQKAAGVEVFTDGEYRRDIFTADITQAVDGLVPGKTTVSFEWRGAGSELAKESKEGNLQFIVGDKLRKKARFTPGEAPFLKQHAPGPFKVCTPAATQHAISRYKPGVSDKVYPTIHDMLQDVAMIMRDEVQALIDEGASYVQLDAPRSAWGAEGSYEPIAEKAFGSLKMDRYLMEFDTERAGGFEPLRFVPKGKTVVLGLITTKEPRLEFEDQLLRRIEQASKYVPMENLALSTQCGFASAASGNLLSWDDMRRKLELVTKIARRAWG